MSETAPRPFTAASFYQFLVEKKLMGAHCPHCATTYLPPRAICPQCHGETLEWVELSGQGKLSAFTSIYIAPTFMIEQGFDRNNPYLTGIVELAEGPKISARLLGFEAAQPAQEWIGSQMLVEFLTRGEGDQQKTDLAFRAT
jgi:hypothetical protein